MSLTQAGARVNSAADRPRLAVVCGGWAMDLPQFYCWQSGVEHLLDFRANPQPTVLRAKARQPLPVEEALTIKSGESHMYALVRSYSGPGAKQLFDLLDERKSDVETHLRPVAGFVSYTLIRTNDGGVSLTVCQDQGGTDESSQVVRDWIKTNAADLNTNPPTVSKGPVILHLT